jgi:type I restriction enzyme R subunit
MYITWQKEICEKCSPDGQIIEQDRIAASLLDKNRLLNLIQNFILYDSNIKKIARHQQFFAVNKAMNRINGTDGRHQGAELYGIRREAANHLQW